MPQGTVVSLDGTRACVSNQPNNWLVMIDLAKRQSAGAIALGESPEGVGISPDERWIAAAIEESNEIVSVDTRSNTKSFAVTVRGKKTEHAVFSPDGRVVFVSAEDGEAVDIIDFERRTQVAQVPVGARPRGVGLSPDSALAYVVTENSNALYVIDARSFKILAQLKARVAQRRHRGAPRQPTFLCFERRRRYRVGVRHRQARDHRDHRGRSAAAEHGADARRQKSLRRLRPLVRGLGDRHDAEHQDHRRAGRQAAVGRGDTLNSIHRGV